MPDHKKLYTFCPNTRQKSIIRVQTQIDASKHADHYS